MVAPAGAYGPLAAAFIVTLLSCPCRGARVSRPDGALADRLELVAGGSVQSGGGLWDSVVIALRLIDGAWQAAAGFGYVAELPQLGGLAGWVVWILTFGIGEETAGAGLPSRACRPVTAPATLP